MKHSILKKLALSTTALVGIYVPAGLAYAQATPVAAAAGVHCPGPVCAQGSDGAVLKLRGVQHAPAPVNSEGDVLRPRSSPAPFKISVDGQTVAGGGFNYEAQQRSTDLALAATDIQIQYDGLEVHPKLNVGLTNDAISVARSNQMVFQAYSNYEAFVKYGEIRIFDISQSVDDDPIMVVPVDPTGRAVSGVPSGISDKLFYQLRVYGHNGKFDETQPKTLSVVNNPINATHAALNNAGLIGGYGVDRTLKRNIDIKGGAITVNGVNVPPGHRPLVMGRPVPVDLEGKFVIQQILPFGDQQVDVSVLNGAQQGVDFHRNIHIKDTEFFYVALGDITLGQRGSIGPANLTAASDQDFDEVVVNGRAAFYLKGKVKGEYLITAALDTGEDRITNLFNNLDDKDPRQLLRRLDADRFYPVYGDDSYTHEDAPTQGRFFVRVDKDDSHVMWGNFATNITGNELAQLDRGLYGAIADYNSEATTRFGERKTKATIFAADPGTIPGRDEFLGTGGSVYFLQRQDLSIGSERVRIEIRDKVTGLVLETRELRPQEDYDIDYIQGRILLSEPLQSTVSDSQVVRSGTLSGNQAYLVTRYEFTPGITDVSGYTVGGRATQWVGENIRVGVTAQNENTATADQELYGADLLLRRSDDTFVKIEYAESKGPGFGQGNSTDGGFIFDDIETPGAAGILAKAYSLETQIKLADLNAAFGKFDTRLTALIEHADEGFSGVGNLGNGEVDRLSLGLRTNLSSRTDINVKYDEVQSSRRGDTTAIYADVNHALSNNLVAKVGVRYDDREITTQAANLSPNRREIDGSRFDASAELAYTSANDWGAKVFAQNTFDRDAGRTKNNRFGAGVDVKLNDRVNLSGEVSGGNGGLGAQAQVTVQHDDNTEYYIGYATSTDRSDTGFAAERESYANKGILTAGGRTRFNDSLSVYGEEQYGHGDRGQQLTHTYGLDFTPDDHWTFGAKVENGLIEDDIVGDFERTAVSVSAGRVSDGLRLATQVEARFEDGIANGVERDRTTWLSRNAIAYDAGEDVELLARLNFAVSESDQSSILDSDYVEGVVGAAYRPVHNDRLNALAKYTYFEDLSPAQQLSSTGQSNLARQKSEIFSIDATYDVTKRLAVGGKIGWRQGEVALNRGSDTYAESDAFLGVVRADLHIVNKWDALVEGRILKSKLSDDERLGGVVGVYRHVGDNFKLGVGYSFSDFSDDLTDFDNDSDGFFLNLVGKI